MFGGRKHYASVKEVLDADESYRNNSQGYGHICQGIGGVRDIRGVDTEYKKCKKALETMRKKI